MMAEGSRWRDEDLDEYEDDGYGSDGYEDEEGGEEEEEEEEEDPKLTQEELDYLKLREKLKERIRQKYRKENASGGSSQKTTPTANAEFGSFFGPSMPVIARRVIEESHSLRETQHITSKTSNSHSVNKRPSIIANGERKIRAPKIVNEVKTKVEALKDMRDYSFLFSDDTDILAASKDPLSRRTSTPNSFQSPPETKLPSGNPRQLSNGNNALKRPASSNQQAQLKVGVSRPSVENRSKLSGSVNSRQASMLMKPTTSAHQSVGLRKSPAVSTNRPSSDRNNSSVRLDHSNKQCQDQRRDSRGFPKMMAAPRQLTTSKPPQSRPQQPSHSSRPQIQSYSSKTQQSGHTSKPHLPVNSSKLQQPCHPSKLQQPGQSSKLQHPGQTLKPTRPGQSSRPQLQGHSAKPQQSGHSLKPQQSKSSKQLSQRGSNVDLLRSKPKKRPIEEPEEDGGDYRSIIRQMFRYNPNRFHDDDDDDNMEANFDDIMREELRSSRIAQKEDEEQLRLIEEEEERERMRKLAKKRRMQ